MQAKVLHSELVSSELASMSLILCKTKLVISVLICLCLHSRYIIRDVEISEITEDANTKISMMQLFEKKFLLEFNILDTCLSFKSKFLYYEHSIVQSFSG